jgi:hypothetical protein
VCAQHPDDRAGDPVGALAAELPAMWVRKGEWVTSLSWDRDGIANPHETLLTYIQNTKKNHFTSFIA